MKTISLEDFMAAQGFTQAEQDAMALNAARELARYQLRRANGLEAALIAIRDSTYRSAIILRGLADRALTEQHPESAE